MPKRDAVDSQIIEEARNSKASYEGIYKTKKEVTDDSKITGIIDTQRDVAGWPELKSMPPPKDTDHDGMPDKWEKKNGLNPKNEDDKNNVGEDGYTMLEKYLNSII
ncbi:MAG: hypothetical protein R8P61_37115 [Bacteroidia bacterium]|nr:hypothetical protein [Bacteroidia bacterium]